jgi:hypothetical protein
MSRNAPSAELEEGEHGVWRASGPLAWVGRYYVYEVRAYHYMTRRLETMVTPDPYSRASCADGQRTLIGTCLYHNISLSFPP